MQAQVSEEIIGRVAKEVLETMAFAFVMPGGEDELAEADVPLRATVRFEGPARGAVCLTMPTVVVPELVMNMLGDDEGKTPTTQQQHDAVGELANVMCGNLVQRLAGPKAVFTLHPPQITSGEEVGDLCASGGALTAARVPLENGWAELALVLDEACAAAAPAGSEGGHA